MRELLALPHPKDRLNRSLFGSGIVDTGIYPEVPGTGTLETTLGSQEAIDSNIVDAARSVEDFLGEGYQIGEKSNIRFCTLDQRMGQDRFVSILLILTHSILMLILKLGPRVISSPGIERGFQQATNTRLFNLKIRDSRKLHDSTTTNSDK